MNTEDSEFERIEREQAMRGVPDAIHHTDTSETLEYITRWNDCRQAMLAEQPAQQEPVALTDDELADLWYKQSLDWMEFARAVEAAHNIKENT